MLKIYSILFFLLSFLGFLDATYLTISHYRNVVPPCSIAHGCQTVLASPFANIAGIPISLLGSLFYLVIIILLLLFVQTKNKKFLLLLFVTTTIGTIISVGLIIIQAAVLHAFCQYCMVSDSITILLFLLVLTWAMTKGAKKNYESSSSV